MGIIHNNMPPMPVQEHGDRWGRRGRLALAVLLLLALALRIWYLQINTVVPFGTTDDGDYYRRALRLATTGRYVDDFWLIRPPFHVFIFAGLLKLGLLLGSPAVGVLLIQGLQILLSVTQIGLSADLARRLWHSERAGLLLGLALALYLPLIQLPSGLFSEQIYLFLLTLHFWLLARFDAGGGRLALVVSGLVLGMAALTRSNALYALPFVAVWLWIRARSLGEGRWPSVSQAAGRWLIFLAAVLVVVLPWTYRNYLVYDRFILIDTLGPTNLWLELGTPATRNEKIHELWKLPQAERQDYAMTQVRSILRHDPFRLFRNIWPHFRHIWKAQFIEDFAVKRSFFAIPLRPVWHIGLASDLIWLAIVLGAAIGIWRAKMVHWWRWLFFLWIAYTLATVMIFHVEPRYLLPLWLMGAWFAAGIWAHPQQAIGDLRARSWRLAGAAAFLLAFLALIVSYRDYPELLSQVWAREQAWGRAEQAYRHRDYKTAIAFYQEALRAAPRHEDVRLHLALALAADGQLAKAWAMVQDATTRRGEAVRGYIALLRDDHEQALELSDDAARAAREDVYTWLMGVVPPIQHNRLTLGTGQGLGAIAGFGEGERDQKSGRPFRWSGEDSRVVLHLTQPVSPGALLFIELGAIPEQADQLTPVSIIVNGRQLDLQALAGWRRYFLALPRELVGTQTLEIRIRSQVFVPQQRNPDHSDNRVLGVMVSRIAVMQGLD